MLERATSPCIQPLHFHPFEIKIIRVNYDEEVSHDTI